jgi:hypothetical protein
MSAIELCRTAALGGHIEHCDRCDHQRIRGKRARIIKILFDQGGFV